MTSSTNGTSDMIKTNQGDAREGASRDGLAAVAIVLLTALLIAFVVINIV